MPALYIRTTTDDGRRTWRKVGHTYAFPGNFLIHLEVYPGKVYHARIQNDDPAVVSR